MVSGLTSESLTINEGSHCFVLCLSTLRTNVEHDSFISLPTSISCFVSISSELTSLPRALQNILWRADFAHCTSSVPMTTVIPSSDTRIKNVSLPTRGEFWPVIVELDTEGWGCCPDPLHVCVILCYFSLILLLCSPVFIRGTQSTPVATLAEDCDSDGNFSRSDLAGSDGQEDSQTHRLKRTVSFSVPDYAHAGESQSDVPLHPPSVALFRALTVFL